MKKKSKNYFTQETEDAIILYNNTSDYSIKSKIYEEKIHYAFFKLTENIIHTFKFYYTEVEQLSDLQHEIIILLLSKIHLYNHRKSVEDRFKKIIIKEFKEKYTSNFEDYVGEVDKVSQEQINDYLKTLKVTKKCREKLLKITPPKAYSYFGTIVKRYCIVLNKKNYTKKINFLKLSDITERISSIENSVSPSTKTPGWHGSFVEDHFEIEVTNPDLRIGNNDDKLSCFIDLYVEYCSGKLFELFPKEQDSKIADAILELFRKRENLEIFNKKALYINIREIINVKAPQITKISDQLHKIFKDKYSYYQENGHFKYL